MPRTTPLRSSKILSLSLIFLLAGLFGCSHGSQGEQAAGSKSAPAAGAAGTAGDGAAAAPAAGAPATGAAASPASPAGASGSAAGIPGVKPAPPAELPPDKIPAVVAKVNGTDIKKADLLKTADQVHKQMMPGAPQTAEFYHRVLDNLVSRELLLQEAKAAGITATDEEINKQLGELKARFPSPEKFQEQLKAEGMTEAELTQKAREAYIVQKLVETKVLNGLAVSEAEEKAFYDQNQASMKRPERVHVRHILVKVDKGASAAEKQKAKEKADSLLAKIKSGGDFAKLAEEVSDDPGSKVRGGDLGWMPRGQTVKPFEDAAFKLSKPNELSPVVESDFGFHIIQLVEHQDPGVVPFAEVKDKIGEFLKQKASQEKVQEHIKELRAKGKVETFV